MKFLSLTYSLVDALVAVLHGKTEGKTFLPSVLRFKLKPLEFNAFYGKTLVVLFVFALQTYTD